MYSPKYRVSNLILKYIGKIEASKEVIENAPLVPAYEAKFRQEAIIRTVHHGTHIEGNPLDSGEVAAVLEGGNVPARDRDVQEILNYREVLKYIDKTQNSKLKIPNFSEKDILTIHKLTVDKVLSAATAGTYRLNQVVVKNSKTGEISFKPPEANKVKKLVGDFLDWLNGKEASDVHPVLKAGITHYVLAFIHPFVDGNGRASRAFATLVLFRGGYDIKKFFSIEEYFDRDSKRYYETLQSVSNQKVNSLSERDLTGWLEYFCEGVAEELERVKQRVQKLSLDTKLKGRTGQIVLNERQVKLVEYIEANGSINNKQWRVILRDFSDDTILRDLKDLQKKKLVKKKGSTKGAVYVLR
ncbi:MAG: Fic family protein [Patescibacteria group bacterium]